MHVLLTGAGGYVGSVVAPALLASGLLSDLTLMVRDQARWLQQPPPWWPGDGIRLVEAADLLDGRWRCTGVDRVLHLAARGREPMQPKAIAEALAFSQALIHRCRQAGVAGFVHASSQAVYGLTPPLWTEQHTPAPVTPYGRSKLAVEQMLQRGDRGQSMASVSLRLAKLVGPSPRFRIAASEWPHVLVQQALRGQPLRLAVPGSQRLDLLDVRDGARCLVALLRQPPQRWPGLLNVGSGAPVTLRELVELVSALAVARGALPLQVELLSDSAAVRQFGMRIEAAQQAIGWQPEIPLSATVASLFEVIQVSSP